MRAGAALAWGVACRSSGAVRVAIRRFSFMMDVEAVR